MPHWVNIFMKELAKLVSGGCEVCYTPNIAPTSGASLDHAPLPSPLSTVSSVWQMSDMLRQAQPRRCYGERKRGDQEGVYLITAGIKGD